MTEFFRRMGFGRIYFYYILGEIIPSFLIGVAVFASIILMSQFMQLSEFVLIHRVSALEILKLLSYMGLSYLPLLLPMSILFAVLLTYSRLSGDSEMVALKSIGISPLALGIPGVLFAVAVSLLSAQTLFVLGPVARFEFDRRITALGNQKIMSSVEEETFSEDFFGLMIYANKIDTAKNIMSNVFIFDSRNPKSPIAIVAKTGRVSTDFTSEHQSASIILENGNMYMSEGTSNRSLAFGSYSLNLRSPTATSTQERDPNTYTLGALQAMISRPGLGLQKLRELKAEFYHRYTTVFSCVVFGLLGAGLGSNLHRRSSASSGFVLSVVCIAIYWLVHAACLNLVQTTNADPALTMWAPNVIFMLLAAWAWRAQLVRA